MAQQKEPDKQVGTKPEQHITDELVKPEHVAVHPEDEELEDEDELEELPEELEDEDDEPPLLEEDDDIG